MSDLKNTASPVMAGEDNALVIERFFDAPRQRVWQAWTDPQMMMQWWGPKDYTAPVCKIDLSVGGKVHCCMRSSDGQDVWSTGTYKEIVPFERLVCTDSFADQDGNVVSAEAYGMPGDFPLELLVQVTFEDLDSRTKMTLRHTGMPPGEMQEMGRQGWNESFDKMAALFA